MEKIIITISNDLLEGMNLASERLNKSRSQLIRQAIADFLRQLRQQEFDELMAEGYRETSEVSSNIISESLELQSEAAGKVWSKDE